MTASEHSGGSRSAADLALDLFVYAPAGALITAASDMPAMAAKGRERIEQELRNAHLVGRFVVDAGVRQVRQQLGWLTGDHPDTAATTRPAPSTSSTSSTASTAARPGAGGTQGGTAGPVAATAGAPLTSAPSTGAAGGAPMRDAAVDRAIPDYDTLSASQVVRRLDGLKPRELRAVVRHELANRGRRTVLNRAEQLLGGSPPAPPATS